MNNPVFYNQERSGYKELVSYGPCFYKDIFEMNANYQFAGKTLDIMAEGLEAIVSNQFIDSAEESTIQRMENWLGIDTDFSRTLEDRKKKVKLVWNGGEKLSGSFIKNLVRSYTGCDDDPVVKMTTHLSIIACITADKAICFSDLVEQLEKMKPASLAVLYTFKFIMIIDCSEIEQFILSHIRFHFKVSFWNCYIFDGSWLLDGSILLNNRPNYEMEMAVRLKQGINMQEEMTCAGLRFLVGNIVNDHMYHSGERFYAAIYEYSELRLNNKHRYVITNDTESIGNLTVITKSSDYWLLDGSWLLDGTKNLNAIYKKEVEDQ